MRWPDAVSFEPSQGTASPALEALLEGPGSAGPVVLLAVGPGAQQSGWAAQSAVALAEAFAARGESVILADLSLHNPELHTVVGIDNDEGLTDVFLFGASLPHVVRAIPGRWLRLIPASAFTPDASEVLQHKRWGGVFEELAATRSKLLAYLPVDVEGAKYFSDRVGHTIVLADGVDLEKVSSTLSEDADVIGVLLRPGSEGASARAPERAPETAAASADATPVAPESPALERRDDAEFEKIRLPKDHAREALIADLRHRQRAALMAPPPSMTPLPQEAAPQAAKPAAVRMPASRGAPRKGSVDTQPVPPLSPPLFTMRAAQRTPRDAGSLRTWLLILLLLVALGAVGWYLWQQGYLTRNRAVPAIAQPTPRPAPIAAAPARVLAASQGVALPYSVAIASYPALATAREQMREAIRAANTIPFYIAPIFVQGRMFFRVMAGPVADSASAMMLRDTLIAKRIKTITSGWDVLATPLAFLLGDYANRGDAAARQQEAEEKGVPTYVVAITSQDGSTTYRLYAGAFTGRGDADFMRQILKSAGYPDSLVERTGS